MTPHEENWLALSLVERVGSKAISTLLERFGSIHCILEAPSEAITRNCGFHPDLAERITRAREMPAFRSEKRLVSEYKAALIPLDSENYPAQLRRVHLPPPILYCLGEIPPPTGPVLAVVGTRAYSRYGEQATGSLIEGLARLDPEVVILSGMARGIDTLAHQKALECGLKTVAVLGGGLAHLYPPENRDLAARIANQGALLSEFSMTQRPLARNFPIRNRVIAGLANAVLVVEAGERSGALITASFALNYNRPVLAIPGNIAQPGSMGTNRVIRSGHATLVRDAEDVMAALRESLHPSPTQLNWFEPSTEFAVSSSAKSSVGPVSARTVQEGEKGKVLEALRNGPFHPDDLAEEIVIPIEKLIGLLLELELSGDIYQTPENQYALA